MARGTTGLAAFAAAGEKYKPAADSANVANMRRSFMVAKARKLRGRLEPARVFIPQFIIRRELYIHFRLRKLFEISAPDRFRMGRPDNLEKRFVGLSVKGQSLYIIDTLHFLHI